MLIELFGTLIFLATVAGALGVLVALVYALGTHRRRMTRSLLVASLIWIAAYGALMVGASVLTPQRVLDAHEDRCFDEMCFSVIQSTTHMTLGTGSQSQAAHGLYYVVTVELRNASLRTAQKPDHPAFFLDDGQGHQYQPSSAGQQAVGQQPVWDARLQPGETQSRTLVFDAPALLLHRSPQPRLGVTEGSWPTPLIIGDENSPWHQKTLIQLAFSEGARAASGQGYVP